MSQVIGLSGKARHGKDTVASYIASNVQGYAVRKACFADGVKEVARHQGWNGEKDDAGRTLLQKIGQGKRAEDELYWVKRCWDKIRLDSSPDVVWVIPDVRYRNEAQFVQAHGGVVWRINRVTPDGSPFDNGLTAEQRLHGSEVDLDDYDSWDAVIINDTIDNLFDQVSLAIESLQL